MAENLELLIGIQEQIIRCRRLAAQIFDPETSRRLYELADEVERPETLIPKLTDGLASIRQAQVGCRTE
jgi:hypothetical protein